MDCIWKLLLVTPSEDFISQLTLRQDGGGDPEAQLSLPSPLHPSRKGLCTFRKHAAVSTGEPRMGGSHAET